MINSYIEIAKYESLSEVLSYTEAFNPSEDSRSSVLLLAFPFYTRGNTGTERFSNLLTVKGLGNRKSGLNQNPGYRDVEFHMLNRGRIPTSYC